MMMIALFAAVERGDAKKVDELLAIPPQNINSTDYRSRTALHLAVEYGHDDVVDVLIGSKDIDLAAKDCAGFTALHLAAELGHDKTMTRLLQKRPQLADARTSNGLTCLHLAVIRDHATIVSQLLATNLGLVNVSPYNGKSALDFAVEYGHEAIVGMIVASVKQSKNLNFVKVMFYRAVKFGYDHVANQLLPELVGIADLGDNFSNPTNMYFGFVGKSVLHLAAEYGRDTIVAKLLIEASHLIDASRTSALHLAVRNGHENVVTQLLAVRPALATQINKEGDTALHLAAANCNERIVAQLLAQNSGLIDVENRRGETPLQKAVVGINYHCIAYGKTVACLLAHRPVRVDANMLWIALNNTKDVSEDEAVKALFEYKPELVESVDRDDDDTVLHRVVGYRVLGYRTRTNDLFSEELMLRVWQMNPGALHKLNRNNRTPFDVAVRRHNRFAIELMQRKLSLDEIVEAFAKLREDCPQAVFAQLEAYLLVSLGKDVVGVVSAYLRSPPRASDSDSDACYDSEACFDGEFNDPGYCSEGL